MRAFGNYSRVMSGETLKWNFEAFRQFLSFEVMQQAAASVMPFDGFNYRDDIATTRKFERYIALRTGLDWAPKREAPEGIFFDTEGSLFRNKARVFTSMGILDALALQSERAAKLTKFGRELGSGLVSSSEYYKFQIETFEYPHAAYPESGKFWESENKSVKPLKFIIELLAELAEHSLAENRLSTREFLIVSNEDAQKFNAKESAQLVLRTRSIAGKNTEAQFTIESKRNATDILGFLCMTGFALFNQGGDVSLNLLRKSKKDKTYFYFKSRDGENALNEIRKELEIGAANAKQSNGR